jgi:putative aldouronate transport system permease protein
MIKTKQEKAFEVFASAVMICVMVIVIFPFLLLFISSITEENTLLINGYSIFPEKLSFDAYKYIWNSRDVIFRAYGITVCVTVIGTLAHVAIVAMAAYPLSLRNLPGRSFFSFVILFTMLFNGGLVPTYMIYTMVFHIKNTYWALLVPNLLFSSFNCIIVRTYLQSNVPSELYESAKIDGASEFQIFRRIVLPLGKPIFVTVGVFAGLNYWNDWTNGLYYISDQSKYSIQQVLNVMVKNIEYLTKYGRGTVSSVPSISLRMAIAFAAMLPILILYPFLTKYFEKGIAVGAVKG